MLIWEWEKKDISELLFFKMRVITLVKWNIKTIQWGLSSGFKVLYESNINNMVLFKTCKLLKFSISESI